MHRNYSLANKELNRRGLKSIHITMYLYITLFLYLNSKQFDPPDKIVSIHSDPEGRYAGLTGGNNFEEYNF